jgi:hypothetical protein
MDGVRQQAPPFHRSDRDQALASWEDEGGSVRASAPGRTLVTSLDLAVALYLCRDLPSDMRLRVFEDLLSSIDLVNR